MPKLHGACQLKGGNRVNFQVECFHCHRPIGNDLHSAPFSVGSYREIGVGQNLAPRYRETKACDCVHSPPASPPRARSWEIVELSSGDDGSNSVVLNSRFVYLLLQADRGHKRSGGEQR